MARTVRTVTTTTTTRTRRAPSSRRRRSSRSGVSSTGLIGGIAVASLVGVGGYWLFTHQAQMSPPSPPGNVLSAIVLSSPSGTGSTGQLIPITIQTQNAVGTDFGPVTGTIAYGSTFTSFTTPASGTVAYDVSFPTAGTYTFQASATNSSGTIIDSNELTIVISGGTSPPVSPPPVSPPPSPPAIGSVAYSTQDSLGNTITGYFVTLTDGSGNPVASGGSPITFSNLSVGTNYIITPTTTFGSCSYSHWLDNASLPQAREFALISSQSNITLAAVYNCSTSSGPEITVNTVNGSGGTITGYDIVVTNTNANPTSANTVASGFSPVSFTTSSGLVAGQTYYVWAESFGSENFVSWSTGTANPATVPAISGLVTLTATYTP